MPAPAAATQSLETAPPPVIQKLVPVGVETKAIAAIVPATAAKPIAAPGGSTSAMVGGRPAPVSSPMTRTLAQIPSPVAGVQYLPVTFNPAKETQ